MKLLRFLECSALALLIAGCVSTSNPGAASARVEPDTPTMRTAKAIDAILYADYSQEERLARLKPYAAPMQSMEDVQKRLEFDLCFGSGPGVIQCQVTNSGLTLVFDPDKKLRLMRREARVVNGVAYPEMSLTDRGFKWHGYQRWYEN
jgi:hypothetical protein